MVDRRKSRFGDERIAGLLKQVEAGTAVADICRKGGVERCAVVQVAVDVLR
ncbi:transposase [Eleftheria terrae]|uniref:transposase n=1 Tax=Eleftheria terrae TaxID=1597781 RepID=UPI00342352CB